MNNQLEEATVATDLAVRFAETDAMGVVHHGAYVVWFECGRVAWMVAAQMPYTEVAASGHHFAVTGIHTAYRASARFGDTVRIITRLTKLRSRQVEFSYEVRKALDATLLATGVSEHVCVDLEGRMAKIPAFILERLEQGAIRLLSAQRVGSTE
ncbi:MAG: thioesterase family protein [Chloroflexi bacterium]|nr:thioesterase family protein [Chloroflexota bacterium]